METSPITPRLNFQALSARLTLQGGNAGKKPAKATERMRRALEDGDDETATEVANNMVRKLQGVGMGKVDKFELGKGLPTFKAGMDLLRYLEDYIFPKVRQPEGGAELHQWIYEKARPTSSHARHPNKTMVHHDD